jgi:hypothetical protein
MLRKLFASYLSWQTISKITHFGLLSEQQICRRSATVRPSLEGVEERIVPSSATQQMAPGVVGLQQEVSNAIQIIEQDIAQLEAILVQEVDHLLGIPTTPNPASGSGAGSGATATHSAPSQHLNSASQQGGSGSGSGATNTAKREFAKAFLPALSYEGRRCRSIRCIIET